MGAISGAALVLARRSVVDWPTIVIAVVTFGLLGVRKIPEPLMILAAGLAGIALFKR